MSGLEITLQVLTESKNDSAVEVLIPALDSDVDAIREGALQALLKRNNLEGHLAILSRWHTCGERWKTIIADQKGRLSWAVREAVLSPDENLCRAGCELARRIAEYDLLTPLISAAEDKPGPRATLAAETIIALTENLYGELIRPRDYSIRRDPEITRQFVLEMLEQSLRRYEKHRRHEILEAFLLLAQRNNATLKRLVGDASERCHDAVLDALMTSQRPGVMRLTLHFLEDPQTPLAALRVLGERSDPVFLRQLFKRLGPDPSEAARKNLRRLDTISWLIDEPKRLLEFDDDEQAAGVQLAVCSGMNRLDVFEVVRYVLLHGGVGGRRAAAAALAEFKGAAANELAQRVVEDSDPGVQARVLRQLRERGIPGAMARLLEHVDSPHAEVRQAIRESLGEFTFDRFLASFEVLERDVRRSTGALVKKLDPNTVPSLVKELNAQSRTRRLRALEIATALGALPDVEEAVLGLLADNDHFLRAEAVRSLAHCSTTRAQQAVREAMLDRSPTVQEAAEETLRKLTRGPAALKDAGRSANEP